MTRSRPRGRRRPGGLAAMLAIVAFVVAALGSHAAGVFSGGEDGGRAAAAGESAIAAPAATRVSPPLPPAPEQQDAVGPLPEPAGAAHVDLTRPSPMSHLRLTRAPKAGLAFDLADGRVLWRRNATRVRPVASLTKLMTALLAVERFGPGQLVRIARESDWVGGSRMGGLKPGRRVRAEVLLKGLLISSSNNAAVALAVAGAGSERAWVALMNRRARLLGLTCTHYADAHGLDRRNRSCAADIATLAMRAMDEPRIVAIARRRHARVWPGSGRKLTLRTTNHLLRDRYPGAIGLKTGYTIAAGFCLVAIVERGERRIGIVTLGSRDAFGDVRRVAREATRMGLLPAA
ncbi:MAG: D-alanyl-D-alanine carboxypeptidase family protein [Thermoleophilia bacterium]